MDGQPSELSPIYRFAWTNNSHYTVPRTTLAQQSSKSRRCEYRGLQSRLDKVEAELEVLQNWRRTVENAVPVAPVAITPAPGVEVSPAPHAASTTEAYPYVESKHSRVHRVLLGYPEAPRVWVTQCGWRFGYSACAIAKFELPRYYKALCEKCFKSEREAARARAETSVAEVG